MFPSTCGQDPITKEGADAHERDTQDSQWLKLTRCLTHQSKVEQTIALARAGQGITGEGGSCSAQATISFLIAPSLPQGINSPLLQYVKYCICFASIRDRKAQAFRSYTSMVCLAKAAHGKALRTEHTTPDMQSKVTLTEKSCIYRCSSWVRDVPTLRVSSSSSVLLPSAADAVLGSRPVSHVLTDFFNARRSVRLLTALKWLGNSSCQTIHTTLSTTKPLTTQPRRDNPICQKEVSLSSCGCVHRIIPAPRHQTQTSGFKNAGPYGGLVRKEVP